MHSFGDPWVLLAAVALDLSVGDPPNRAHPVAAMGWLIGALRKRVKIGDRRGPLLAGFGIVVLGVGLSVAIGVAASLLRNEFPWAGVAVEVVLLKLMFSVRGLSR